MDALMKLNGEDPTSTTATSPSTSEASEMQENSEVEDVSDEKGTAKRRKNRRNGIDASTIEPRTTTVTLRPDLKLPIQKVREKHLPRGTKAGARPNRSEEEILDSLHNWEKFVDPAHLQELYDAGIKKEVLNTAFLTMRYHNKSFGPLDLAMKGERLEPKRKIGSRYENAVRRYVKELRSLLTSQENPGMFVEAMFAPGEEVDITLIDGPHRGKAGN